MRHKFGWRAGIALFSVVCMGTSALAQQGGGRGDVAPPLTERDADAIERLLDLTDDQSELFHSMVAEAMAEYEFDRAAMTAFSEDVRESFRNGNRDRELLSELRESMREFSEKVDQLRADVYENLQLVLTQEQVDLWPVIDRRDRRRAQLRGLTVTGSNVDLIAVLERSLISIDTDEIENPAEDGTERTAVTTQTLSDRYEMELDRVLRQVESLNDDLQDVEDRDERLELLSEFREHAIDVRDLNTRYAERIAQALEGTIRDSFQATYWRSALPRQAGVSASGVFNRVESLGDLTDDQRVAIASLRDEITPRVNSLNESLRDAWYEWEDGRTVEESLGNRRGRRGSARQGVPEDVREILDDRNDLLSSVRERLESLLTPEQIESIVPAQRNAEERPQRPNF